MSRGQQFYGRRFSAAVKPSAPSIAPPAKRSTSFDPDVAAAMGQVIRAAREALGHSQDGFALLAGVDRSYYGKLERGERQPTVGLLLRVAKALDVSGSALLAEAEALLAAPPKRRRSSIR